MACTETLRPLVTTLVTRNMVVTTLRALNEGRYDPPHITTLRITTGRYDITTPSVMPNIDHFVTIFGVAKNGDNVPLPHHLVPPC